jgi:MFS family permease
LAELLRLQRREIVLAAGSVLGAFSFGYMASSYLTTYGNTDLGHSRNVILFVGVLGGLAAIAFAALSATLSDRVGRRRMMLVGSAACLPWSFVVIPLMDTGKPICYAVAIVGMQAISGIGFGPITAFFPELFATGYRYSGTALAETIAGVAGGALPAPDRRHTARHLRQHGDRSHADNHCRGQPRIHLSAAGDHRNDAAVDSRCR